MPIGVGGGSEQFVISHDSRFQAYVVATTSAAGGVIVQASGAHTLYVTDAVISVDGPKDVSLASETTVFAKAYLATKGGFVFSMVNPYVCNSAESLRVILSSSGDCAVSVIGYTVT